MNQKISTKCLVTSFKKDYFFIKPWMLFLVLGTIIVGTGILYVGLPASPDQLDLDYIAGIVLNGGTPYVDFVDNNWPGAYWLHMISTAFFGHSLHSWRFFDYLIMLVGLLFLCDFLRRSTGILSALWAAVLYPGLYTTAVSFDFPGQRDAVIANLIWIILWSHWRAWEKDRSLWQIIVGLLLALATLIKPPAILIGLLLVFHGLWKAKSKEEKWVFKFLRQEGTAAITGLVVLAIAFAAIISAGTPTQALLDSIWFFNIYPQCIGNPHSTLSLQKALSIHLISWHWIFIGSFLSAAWLIIFDRCVDSGIKFLLVIVWIAGWGSYFIQGRHFPYPYHLAIVYAGMLPFLFIGLGKISEFLRTGSFLPYKIFAVLSIGIVVLGLAKKYDSQYATTFRWFSGNITTVEYYNFFPTGYGITLGDVYSLLPIIEESVAPKETLLMIGAQSATNYLLQRRQPIRFYYFPIFLEAHMPTDMVYRWNMLFRSEIKQDHSPMALVNRTLLSQPPCSGNPSTIKSIKILKQYLAEHFIKIKEIGMVDLYKRRL